MKKLIIPLVFIVGLLAGIFTGYLLFHTEPEPKPLGETTLRVSSKPIYSKYEIGPPDAQEIFELVNKVRKDHGLSQLNYNKTLEVSACDKVKDMAEREYWSHESPSGETPWKFIAGRGYYYSLAGENLYNGRSDTSESVMDAWMDSESHKKNILENRFIDMGVCFVVDSDYMGNGRHTIGAQHFARP